jgi:SSS family solute:Na+ symporter
MLTVSRILTLVVGFSSVGFALYVPRVIDSILLAYSFMVAGLFFPTLGALFWRRTSGTAAFWSIVGGGATTVGLTVAGVPLTLDPVFYGLGVSAVVLVILTLAVPAPSGVSRGRNKPII